jgi:hypothetical protein
VAPKDPKKLNPKGESMEIKWPRLKFHKHDSIPGFHTDEAVEGCIYCIENRIINECKQAYADAMLKAREQ